MTSVLLVDDDEDLATLMAEQLRRLGYAVRSAFSVEQAKERAQLDTFDVLITDGHLDDGDAAQVAEAVPTQLRVLLSGTAGLVVAGFDVVLLKPTSAEALADAISRRLHATP